MRPRACLPAAVALAAFAVAGPTASQDSLSPPPQAAPSVAAPQPICEKPLRYYPTLAQEMGVDGRAVLDCEVEAAGAIGDCHVVSETPPGYDFGEHALCLAPLMKMRTVDKAGNSTVGKRMQIPIRFTVPRD